MALLTVQDLSAGGSPSMVAAAGGGDQIPQGTKAGGWGKSVFLLVRNTDAAARTVTVAGQAGVVVAATTGLAVIPVFGIYKDQVRAVTYTAVTGVTVAAVAV